jgi:hypothetical protein
MKQKIFDKIKTHKKFNTLILLFVLLLGLIITTNTLNLYTNIKSKSFLEKQSNFQDLFENVKYKINN